MNKENCALKLVDEIILYYDARSKKQRKLFINPLNAELNPICHLLALLGSATIVVVSKLRVKVLYYDARSKKQRKLCIKVG